MLADIRQAVAEVTPDLPIAEIGTLAQAYRDHPSMARSSFSLALLGIAGATALLLSIVGIYGVLAYAVTQRRREVGIRRRAGRRTAYREKDVRLSGADSLGHRNRAWGRRSSWVDAVDVVAAIWRHAPRRRHVRGCGSVLGGGGALASYIPARRAATIDPMETLRAE